MHQKFICRAAVASLTAALLSLPLPAAAFGVLARLPTPQANPLAQLLPSADGGFYATASGEYIGGHGSVFELLPPGQGRSGWTTTTLYAFSGGWDGYRPAGPLIADSAGALYGTTANGGPPNATGGVVFKLMPPAVAGGTWTEQVLHAFSGLDGLYPLGGLAMDAKGDLFGTTLDGGQDGVGNVYELTPPPGGVGAWTEQVLHAFTSFPGGGYPAAGPALGPDGALYGTTANGGTFGFGTVWRLHPIAGGTQWAYRTIFDFAGLDGSYPGGPLTIDRAGGGAIYGTTPYGGTFANGSIGYGVVFKLVPPSAAGGEWSETVVLSLNNTDGANPSSVVTIGPRGSLYVTPGNGGAANKGSVIRLTPGPAQTWNETVLYSFPATGEHGLAAGDGQTPTGVVFGQDKRLYGLTTNGGPQQRGVAFVLHP